MVQTDRSSILVVLILIALLVTVVISAQRFTQPTSLYPSAPEVSQNLDRSK